MDLNLLCHYAKEAALQAGSIIQQHQPQQVHVDQKSGRDSEASQVVTEVDYKAQQAIIEILYPTLRDHDLALLAEESADDGQRLVKPAFWCIDPMDGTLAFINRVHGFSVSIALVARNGEPLIGVVYDPVNRDCYHAIKGAGAFKNNQPFNTPHYDPNYPLTLITDISFENHPYYRQTQKSLDIIAQDLGLPGANIDLRIGAVMNAISTLSTPNSCYFKFARGDNNGGSLWDYAATACLFNEAGAIACDIHGNAMDLNRRDSTFMNHRGIIYGTSKTLVERIIDMNKMMLA